MGGVFEKFKILLFAQLNFDMSREKCKQLVTV